MKESVLWLAILFSLLTVGALLGQFWFTYDESLFIALFGSVACLLYAIVDYQRNRITSMLIFLGMFLFMVYYLITNL
ncbi:hypothetical protein N781_02205 [Pontibacillus halophilus JSM 076056 = DSM 19796]|uniref:Uncharacterized protein n=1 Tax=Pontibacillus halophilus JSM 076056 = DSM 19796 TaxID=1385510 RepID=A0A0A5GLF2_9BACI|nr:hypothetical protein [Pontibacillus halophilus]KGX94106.1 hypothetical protein N781_02205 [Pontibacillus halophilus JSM 076056 = DSM 19796]